VTRGGVLEIPTVREIINRLEREGFVRVRQRGSHRRYEKGDRKVTVAGGMKDRPKPKTYQSIKKQADW
jgi:predicted RNA binding protein YcfA (HicA-like mRNA interferase family)